MPIRQLNPDVAAKIAAGEVVERPASVVKELIENSIDAGATQIRVELMSGGLQLIRVSDNGSGIPADELALALSRHATSKVATIDDLEHIRSLGFRGEALASIAAVADVTLASHHRGAQQGAQISAGQEVTAAALHEGTILTVRNLFSAVPARLKFLKSRNTEVGHCLHLLEQYALAYPEIRFSVFSEGRQMFATPGDGQLSSVLIEIYGLQVAEQMTPISSLDGQRDDDPTRPVVSGYTSLPTCYKSTRQHMSFFVNRRWVMSRMLSSAVEEAYHTLLLNGRHPIAVVNIALDPSQIDVNVHPAKTEIRFLRERRVYAAILRAVRSAILEEAQMPRWGKGNAAAQPPSSANTQAPAARDNDEFDLPDETPPDNEDDTTGDPTLPRDNPWLTVTEEETGTKPPLLSRLWQSHLRVNSHPPVGADLSGTPPIYRPEANTPPISRPEANTPPIHRPEANTPPMYRPESDAPPMYRPESNTSLPARPESNTPAVMNFDDQNRQPLSSGQLPPSCHPERSEASPLLERDSPGTKILRFAQDDISTLPADRPALSRLPQLRVVGQLSQSYIVTEGPDGMYLIDQHAAHERILLERMIAALQARAPLSQLLLTPVQLELAPTDIGTLEERLEQLQHIGFSIDIAGHDAVEIRAVPQALMKQINARSLKELLLELIAPEEEGHAETWEEFALANVACKAAIKQNYFLTASEMREMVEQLGQTNAPFSCCHGRPTMVHFSLSALEREFGRR